MGKLKASLTGALQLLPVVLLGCAQAQVQVRNDDTLIRTEQRRVNTQWMASATASREDAARILVQARAMDQCEVTRVVDRTKVEERTLSDEDDLKTWVEGAVGVVGAGLLTTGGIMAAAGEPAFTVHKLHSTGETTMVQTQPAGYLITLGAAMALALIPAIHNIVESTDRETHVGAVREGQHFQACGVRPAADAVIAMDHIGRETLDRNGQAVFDLRPYAATVLRDGPTFALSVENAAVGDTGDAITPFYDELRRAHDAEEAEQLRRTAEAQREAEAARLEREAAEQRSRAAEERARAAQAESEAREEERRSREARVAAEQRQKRELEERTAREQRRKAEALRRLGEVTQ